MAAVFATSSVPGTVFQWVGSPDHFGLYPQYLEEPEASLFVKYR